MSGSLARMGLECRVCHERASGDAALEAWKLHFQVEHGQDEVDFDLVAICECGATMTYVSSDPVRPGRTREQFRCPACGKAGSIMKGDGWPDASWPETP